MQTNHTCSLSNINITFAAYAARAPSHIFGETKKKGGF